MISALFFKSVWFSETHVYFQISDDRIFGIPMSWMTEFQQATNVDKQNWKLFANGTAIHWTDLDIDISVESLFYPTPLIHKTTVVL